jgi:hypothetical protein
MLIFKKTEQYLNNATHTSEKNIQYQGIFGMYMNDTFKRTGTSLAWDCLYGSFNRGIISRVHSHRKEKKAASGRDSLLSF